MRWVEGRRRRRPSPTLYTLKKTLQNIGLSPWSESQFESHLRDGLVAARVVAVHRTMMIVHDGRKEIKAELTGRLQFIAVSPSDLPTVGDWVTIHVLDDGEFAVVHEVMPRRSVVVRKAAGSVVEEQLIAANVDVAFIVQACDMDFNLRRLERYLAAVRTGNVRPIILLSKSDVISPDELQHFVDDIHTIEPFLPIVPFSNNDPDQLASIEGLLEEGKTYCLIGSSGVGKSTLVNRLIGSEKLKTSAIREKDGKRKHTTTSRQLIVLKNKAVLIDTPGMREFGAVGIESGLQETFLEIEILAEDCKFGNFSHTVEVGCALLATIETGELEASRLNEFLKLKRESARNEMSLADKRKKDRSLGKLYKRILDEKKDRR